MPDYVRLADNANVIRTEIRVLNNPPVKRRRKARPMISPPLSPLNPVMRPEGSHPADTAPPPTPVGQGGPKKARRMSLTPPTTLSEVGALSVPAQEGSQVGGAKPTGAPTRRSARKRRAVRVLCPDIDFTMAHTAKPRKACKRKQKQHVSHNNRQRTKRPRRGKSQRKITNWLHTAYTISHNNNNESPRSGKMINYKRMRTTDPTTRGDNNFVT